MNATPQHTISASEGERADLPKLGNRYVLRGEDTGGHFALVEHTIAPRALAAPMHLHEREDEYSFVLEGRMGAQIGDDVLEAGPGELVRKPRGIPHAFWSATDEVTRVLEIVSPAGFEQYFADIAPLLAVEGPPDLDALGTIRERYGLTMDMGSIERLTAEHDLHD